MLTVGILHIGKFKVLKDLKEMFEETDFTENLLLPRPWLTPSQCFVTDLEQASCSTGSAIISVRSSISASLISCIAKKPYACET